MMNKPIIIERKEFVETLVELINSSNLPAFIIENDLRYLLDAVSKLVEKQEIDAQSKWDEYLASEEDNKEDSEDGERN